MKVRGKTSTFLAGASIAAAVALTPTLASAQTDTLVVIRDQVGINVSDPADGVKLHVRAASTGPVDSILLENTTGPARLNLQNLSVSSTATTDQKWTINSNGDLRFTAGDDGAEMRLDAAGNLKVLSSVIVGGVPINVPDYVFDPEYRLMPLQEVKDFVAENRHLPDIPSSKDINRNGLDMTDMQLRLLQKVEELTLYTLEQHETIELLKARLDALEPAQQ
jgi:hypothetical protein